MKKLLFTILTCFGASLIHAQSPTLQWAKGFGAISDETTRSIAYDASGNIYSCGSFSGTVDFDPGVGTFTLASSGVNDVFISKLNALGNFVWAKRCSGGSDEKANSIAIDGSGNVCVTGYFYGTVDFDPSAATYTLSSTGQIDIFVLKLNSSGNFVWANKLGGPKSDIGLDLTVDASGNIYTTGSFCGAAVDFDPGAGTYTLSQVGTNQNNSDIFISKLNSSGAFVWAKSFGSDSVDWGNSIKTDAAGNIYTQGIFYKTPDFDPGAGTYTMTALGTTQDVFVSKLDALGNFVWADKFGGNGPDFSVSLTVDNSNNVYSVGMFNATAGVADFDPGPGTFTMSTGNGSIFICKLSGSSGSLTWAKQIGKNIGGSSLGYDCITTDAAGNLYITGGFSGTSVDFDPDPLTTYTLTSATGTPDLFIEKITPAGNLAWCVQMGGPGTGGMHGNAISVDASGSVYAAGDFWGTCDFDPSVSTSTLTSIGYGDDFIVKLNQTVTGITESKIMHSFQTYPNPNNGEFTIKAEEDITISIVNELGQTLQTISLNENNDHLLKVSGLSNGIYFITSQNKNTSVHQKVIVAK